MFHDGDDIAWATQISQRRERRRSASSAHGQSTPYLTSQDDSFCSIRHPSSRLQQRLRLRFTRWKFARMHIGHRQWMLSNESRHDPRQIVRKKVQGCGMCGNPLIKFLYPRQRPAAAGFRLCTQKQQTFQRVQMRLDMRRQ